jgi:hypothetical protein
MTISINERQPPSACREAERVTRYATGGHCDRSLARQNASENRIMSITNTAVISQYFKKQPHGREVTFAEMKALSQDDRCELAKLAAIELGLREVAPAQYE